MEQLLGLRRADAAIVGGGLTGLLLGASLSQTGMNVALLEAGDGAALPPWEAAALDMTALMQAHAIHGDDTARNYAAALQTQLNTLLSSPLPYVRQRMAYTYARSPAELPLLEQQQALYTRLGIPVSVAPDAGGCPFPVELSLMTQGVLVDMSRWMAALSGSIRRMGGRIFLHSRVTGFDGPRVCTERGCLHAPVVIMATGMPLGLGDRRLLSLLETRVTVHCALTGDAPLHSMQKSVSGTSALTPTPTGILVSQSLGRCGTRQQQAAYSRFEHILQARLPDFQQGEPFFTQTVHTLDGLPFIGAMPGTNHLCITGAGGILGAMHGAELLTRHILGKTRPEDALYAPTRKLPPGLLHRALRRNTLRRLEELPRWQAPGCAHCGCRMRYFSPASRWACPVCGSSCSMLGHPFSGPGVGHVHVSPRQRPVE